MITFKCLLPFEIRFYDFVQNDNLYEQFEMFFL